VSTSSKAGAPAGDRDRLSDHDKSIIGQAHQLIRVSGPAAVRAYFGTNAVSSADSAHAYAEALGQATWVIREARVRTRGRDDPRQFCDHSERCNAGPATHI